SLFAARTWWYTGMLSLLYGTSFPVQETGLRLTTIGSPAVWAQIVHSLRALVWMNEPPGADLRAAFVVAGVLLSFAALLQIPFATATIGAVMGAFVAHAHHYPGRMSVHLVPFAVAMTVCAASQLVFVYRTRTASTPKVALS